MSGPLFWRRKLNCAHIQNLLSAYADNELSGAQMYSVRQHIAICPHCAVELDSIAQLKALASAVHEVEPPAGFESRLRASIAKETSRQSKPGAPWGIAAAAAAAVVLIALQFAPKTQFLPQSRVFRSAQKLRGNAEVLWLTIHSWVPLPLSSLEMTAKKYLLSILLIGAAFAGTDASDREGMRLLGKALSMRAKFRTVMIREQPMSPGSTVMMKLKVETDGNGRTRSTVLMPMRMSNVYIVDDGRARLTASP